MARPTKNNCDYFSHDKDMRNHRKVKALRHKFKTTGYAVWNMLLEYLTGADGNVFEDSEHELELMSGDFDVSVTEIREILDYCIRMEMLFEKNGFIHSESLDERLSPVYEKRKVAKSLSKKQLRKNGKFVIGNTETLGVSVTVMPQSKVKESKVNKTILKIVFDTMPKLEDIEDLPTININSCIERMKISLNTPLDNPTIISMWKIFKTQNITGHNYYPNLPKVYSHFENWLTKQKFTPQSGNNVQKQMVI